jgi:hypothetical protein
MSPILKRILINGLFTAATLAVVGIGYAEMAGFWLVAQAPQRLGNEAPIAAAPVNEPLADSLKYRVPAMMALWGFLFVAAVELGLHWLRRGKPVPAKSATKPEPASTQQLLEQILAKAEAEKQISQ